VLGLAEKAYDDYQRDAFELKKSFDEEEEEGGRKAISPLANHAIQFLV